MNYLTSDCNLINDAINAILTSEIDKTLDYIRDFRDLVIDDEITFDEIEDMALPLGSLNQEDLSNIEQRAYVDTGIYMKITPLTYSKTRIEIIRPAYYALKRDTKQRIVEFQSGVYRITTVYIDSGGTEMIYDETGKPIANIWRFSSISLYGPGSND